MTPTLSVAAVQLRLIWVALTAVAVRPVTSLGGVVSAGGVIGRGPIRLNLGERQHAAVDADFVEQPAERYCCPEQVADRHDVARTVRFQGLGGRGDQGAIHIDLERIGAVRERHGDMVPVRIGDRAGDGVAGGEGAKRELVAGIEIELFTAALPEGAVALAEEMPLGAAQHIALGPEFDRKVRRAEVEGRRDWRPRRHR